MINPDSAETHFNLASCYCDKEDFELAKAHFEDAVRLNPSNADSYIGLANCLSRGKQPGRAREVLERAKTELGRDNAKIAEALRAI